MLATVKIVLTVSKPHLKFLIWYLPSIAAVLFVFWFSKVRCFNLLPFNLDLLEFLVAEKSHIFQPEYIVVSNNLKHPFVKLQQMFARKLIEN